MPPTASSTARAFSSISSCSASGSEAATIAPPDPICRPWGDATSVRMTMLRSAVPLTDRNPSAPEYTPRGPDSSRSMISIVRSFGAPVIEPPGNAARMQSIADASSRRRPRTVVTSWWTVA